MRTITEQKKAEVSHRTRFFHAILHTCSGYESGPA
jgi:hypothetical protein